MPCSATIKTWILKGPRLRVRAACNGVCVGGGKCIPRLDTNALKDPRFELEHTRSDEDEYVVELKVLKSFGEEVSFAAVCLCDGEIEGDRETLRFIEFEVPGFWDSVFGEYRRWWRKIKKLFGL